MVLIQRKITIGMYPIAPWEVKKGSMGIDLSALTFEL